MNTRRNLWILWWVQLLLMNALFSYQGGFGAGHGTLDGLIFLAGLPGSLIVYQLSLPVLWDSIWVLVILEPALLNGGLYLGICFLRSRRKKLGVSE